MNVEPTKAEKQCCHAPIGEIRAGTLGASLHIFLQHLASLDSKQSVSYVTPKSYTCVPLRDVRILARKEPANWEPGCMSQRVKRKSIYEHFSRNDPREGFCR